MVFFTVKVDGITAAAAASSAAAAVEVGRARVWLTKRALSGCGGEEATNAIVVEAFLW